MKLIVEYSLKVFLFLFVVALFSCNPMVVDEFCYVSSIIDGDYVEKTDFLALAKDHDTCCNPIDTFYLRIDKKTKNKFKLKDLAEYEAYDRNPDYDVVQYIYLKGSNQTEVAWRPIMVNHNITKYDKERLAICSKDLTDELLLKI